jgi:hypothetical protein
LNFFFGVPSASVPTDSALSDLAFLASVTDFALETLFAGFTFSLSPSSIKSSSSSSSSASSSKTSSFSFFLANFLTAAVGFDVAAVAGLFVANSSRVSGNELNISSSESESESSITKAVFLFPDPFVGELEFD